MAPSEVSSFLDAKRSVIDNSFADKDMVKLYLWVRHGLKGTSNLREPAVSKIREKLTLLEY
jgi:hypothetical protein